MSIFGKISAGVRRMTTGPRRNSRSESTTNVYGLLSARRTIHIKTPLAENPFGLDRTRVAIIAEVGRARKQKLIVLLNDSFSIRRYQLLLRLIAALGRRRQAVHRASVVPGGDTAAVASHRTRPRPEPPTLAR